MNLQVRNEADRVNNIRGLGFSSHNVAEAFSPAWADEHAAGAQPVEHKKAWLMGPWTDGWTAVSRYGPQSDIVSDQVQLS